MPLPQNGRSSPSETSDSTCDEGLTDADEDTRSDDTLPPPETAANDENTVINMVRERRLNLAREEAWHDYESEEEQLSQGSALEPLSACGQDAADLAPVALTLSGAIVHANDL